MNWLGLLVYSRERQAELLRIGKAARLRRLTPLAAPHIEKVRSSAAPQTAEPLSRLRGPVSDGER